MRVEPLDDLGLLGAQLNQISISSLFDAHFPDHGKWQGISGGNLAAGWLLYTLSESDHRLSHVEDWATARLNSLSVILNCPSLRALDFCDDRLARLLDRYSDDASWQGFEQSLGKKVLEVYKLNDSPAKQDTRAKSQVIRADSFNAPQFRDQGELFRYGHSKQRRTDQPFCKVMMASLDPLSLPLAVEVVKGSGTDAEHYLPLIDQVRATLGTSGHLYVGDSQLGSIANRMQIDQAGDYYLCPLNRKQCSQSVLSSYIEQVKQPFESLQGIFTEADSSRKPAYFWEVQTELIEQEHSWQERRILVYSPQYAEGLKTSFDNRLEEAETAIENLVIFKRGRRNPKTLEQLHVRIDRIIKKYKVKDCFEIDASEQVNTYQVRKHKNRPERVEKKVTLALLVKRRQKKIAEKRKQLGWQIYATNAPKNQIDTEELVRCYRNEYRIEHLFDTLINRQAGLLPIFLKKEKRVKALIRFLSVAIRISALIQYQVRKKLAQEKKSIKGIYPGNKGRETTEPTTSMLLRAFKGIATVWIEIQDQTIIQMTELTFTQKEILKCLQAQEVYKNILTLLRTDLNLRET